MSDKLKIIKVGGNVIDDPSTLSEVLHSFSKMEGHKILIHGGGKKASEFSRKLGIEPQMINGRRITSAEDIDIVTMIYAGLINKNIVAQLQALGCNAAGFTGADGNSILSIKRPVKPIDFGFVGDVKTVNHPVISQWLQDGICPVFCAITHDGNGQLLNTNADTIASELAIALAKEYETELIYCFEKQGVLADLADDNSVIENIDSSKYEALKNANSIHDGMLPKMENCFHALKNKVSKVCIGNINFLKDETSVHSTLIL
ncbi:acetylglutamate kinase [Owenweeksia hongkongensis]|uniref:acetylglutamate kinase n=1 Tax=Owenweeksia hongkongensis TaxID=253245 RepID=UPI003A920115